MPTLPTVQKKKKKRLRGLTVGDGGGRGRGSGPWHGRQHTPGGGAYAGLRRGGDGRGAASANHSEGRGREDETGSVGEVGRDGALRDLAAEGVGRVGHHGAACGQGALVHGAPAQREQIGSGVRFQTVSHTPSELESAIEHNNIIMIGTNRLGVRFQTVSHTSFCTRVSDRA